VDYYAGLDVSLELTSVCVVDAQGQVVREAKVASEPEALIGFLRTQELDIGRVGLEAGPLSQWLHAGLITAGFKAVLLETRHVKAALSAMTVKTDRRDARGIAQLLRLGWYRPVHAKSASAQEVRSLLTARKLIQGKLLDIESGIRGVLRGFGLKVGRISRGRFEARILDLVAGHAILETVVGSMLAARTALQAEFTRLHRALLVLVRADPVCRQLMSVPGVGAVVAITFRSGVDDPTRFRRSRDIGPHFGLTPRKYQSGEKDVTGSITKVGDRMVRTALYEAASVMLTRTCACPL
jgi:transposase